VSTSPLRYKRLIQELPKHNYIVKRAAIAAGFTEQTADKSGKRLVKAAMKNEVKELAERLDNNGLTRKESKQLMRDILGLSREEVMGQLKNIALNGRDYASALKVLGPIAKEEGVILQEDENTKVTVPILNLTIKENQTTAQQSAESALPQSTS
jgi:hypothetical protein